jgi:eukaryotic-like serine/threonine-protein kinase
MALPPRTRLGPYEIAAQIGVGGMGEVYRATDTSLKRAVAIKVLPDTVASDAARLARFQREAEVLAALNHSNIAAIYGLERTDTTTALVLELVEGPTLADRIRQGPIPLDEALGIARQIAEALEAAHDQGIIHRDLKPSNIKVRPDGTVKVLDFGLAKALEHAPDSGDASQSPTITSPAMTRAGVILGTAAYMSPEQAKGRAADKRSDVWAFGCVLYEMLTGKRAYEGEGVGDTLGLILTHEPDWAKLPANIPSSIRTLLRRCLERDRKRRLADIADARLETDDALTALTRPSAWSDEATAPATLAVTSRARVRVVWGLTGIAVGAVAASVVMLSTLTRQDRPSPQPLMRLSVAVPSSVPLHLGTLPALAFAPDGSRLVYVADSGGGRRQLFVRSLDQRDPTPIPGTEGAFSPFFSPDGRWVGFGVPGKLKKVSLSGGGPVTLCDGPLPIGSWGSDDIIVFTGAGGLMRIAASGGTPTLLPGSDRRKPGAPAPLWPVLLPDSKTVLFNIQSGGSHDEDLIAVQSLETGETRTLDVKGSYPRYASSGHIVYARGKGLWAVPFDLARQTLTGPPVLVLDGVMVHPPSGAAQFALSANGTLMYVPFTARMAERALVWVDRRGVEQPVTEKRGGYVLPRLSPDGQRIALLTIAENLGDIAIYEIARDSFFSLTLEKSDVAPIWTPDGKRVVFSSARAGPLNLFWIPADGSGAAERLTTNDYEQFPTSWSPDGQYLAFTQVRPSWDLWVLPMAAGRKPQPFLATSHPEGWPEFSRDGRWLAYTSLESGRSEVHVRPFPGPGATIKVSTDGGAEAIWASNGRELFYRSEGKMMAVAVTTHPIFTAARPRVLFEGRFERGPVTGMVNYDVTRDGQRFLMVKSEASSSPTQVEIVLNWFGELKRRVPTN